MYALANVTMSSNYNVPDRVNDGMRLLCLDELDFVSGGSFSWAGFGAVVFTGAIIGGLRGSIGGFPGMAFGALEGAAIAGFGFYTNYTFRRVLM